MEAMQAYRFALDPTPGQERDLARHAGAARFAFNWALAAVKANLAQRDSERSYGLAGTAPLTPPLGWNLPALRRAWNRAKCDVAPWWAECSKEAYNTGLDGLARALRNYTESKQGNHAGKRIGFPHFRSRRHTTPSVRFTTGTIRVEPDRHHVTLPRVGIIRTHESTRKLARRLENGTARIMSATVRREAGRWHVAFTVEIQRPNRRPAHPNRTAGVDVGIAHLAVLSTGEVIANPRHLDHAQRDLRRIQRTLARRQGPDRHTGQRASKRWERANTRRNQVHHRVANLRRDGLHKLTTRLAREYGVIVVEDLNVAGMLSNHRLARRIADAGFGEIRRMLGYKTTWMGGRLETADRWFPSSKTCSACQTVKPKMSLAERKFTCEHCGLVLDRDLNAARNLKHYVARSGWETENGRRADRKTTRVVAGGCETSTPRPIRV